MHHIQSLSYTYPHTHTHILTHTHTHTLWNHLPKILLSPTVTINMFKRKLKKLPA